MVDYNNSKVQDILGDIGKSLEKLVNIQWLITGTAIINLLVLFSGSLLNSSVLLTFIFSILFFFSIVLGILIIFRIIREIQLFINLKKCSDTTDDKKVKKLYIFWLITAFLSIILTILSEYIFPYNLSQELTLGSVFIELCYNSLFALPAAVMNIITVFIFISWIQPLSQFMKSEYSKTEIDKATNQMKIGAYLILIPGVGLIGSILYLLGLSKSGKILNSEFKEIKESKIQTNDARAAFLFMLPALTTLLLFIFIPIIFSFLMSLFKNPAIIELADNLIGYYTTFSNLNNQSLFAFFKSPDYSIFVDRGIYLIILALVFLWSINYIYKLLSKFTNISRPILVILAVFCGLGAAPLLIYLFQILCYIPIVLPIENYRYVLSRAQIDFLRVLFNTVFWTVVCTGVHVILGIFLAVLLNRNFKGKGFFRGIFILPWAIPSFASTVIWKNFIFHEKGFLGSRTADIFPNPGFYFNTGSLTSIIIGALVIVIFFVIINQIIVKQTKIKQTYKNIIRFLFLILAFVLGYVVFNLINPVLSSSNSGIFNYNIIAIDNTRLATFWFTASVEIFGLKFRMITFSAILINIWLGVPFMMVSFLAAMQSIPGDLYEAAEIDGSNNWERFKQITLPLLKPTFFTVSLLGFVWTFNLFNVVYILARNMNIPENQLYLIFVTYIYDLFDVQHEYAQAAALSFIVFIMLLTFSKNYNKIFNMDKMFIGNEPKSEDGQEKNQNKQKKNKKFIKTDSTKQDLNGGIQT